MSGGAWIHRVIITFCLVHLDAENLQFLSGVPLSRVGFLETWQGCRTAAQTDQN